MGRVVLVANGISDAEFLNVRRLLAKDHTSVLCYRVDHNTGSAGGFHLGIRSAIQQGAKSIWLLDDDNIARADSLTLLLDSKEKIEVSLREPVVVTSFRPDDGVQRRSLCVSHDAQPPAGSFLSFDLWSMLRSTRRVGSITQNCAIRISLAPYGGLLLDRSVVARIGLPETAMLLYEDDSEYTNRLTSIGVKLFLIRASIIIDNDTKWSQSKGRSRRLGIMDSTDLARIWLAARNRAFFDRERSKTWIARIRFHGNRLVFISVAFAFGVGRGQFQQFSVLRHGALCGRKTRRASELCSTDAPRLLNGQSLPMPLDESTHREHLLGSC